MDRTRRAQGFVTITAMGARRKYPFGMASNTLIANMRTPQVREYEAADFTADGSQYYVDVQHGLGTMAVMYQCYNQDGDDIIPEGARRSTDAVRIWFGKAFLYLTVVVL